MRGINLPEKVELFRKDDFDLPGSTVTMGTLLQLHRYFGIVCMYLVSIFQFVWQKKRLVFFQEEDKTSYILQFPSKKYPLPTGQFCEVFNLCGDFANIFKYVGLCEDTILRYLREDDMTSLLTIQAITTKPISENI